MDPNNSRVGAKSQQAYEKAKAMHAEALEAGNNGLPLPDHIKVFVSSLPEGSAAAKFFMDAHETALKAHKHRIARMRL